MTEAELRAATVATWTPRDGRHARAIICPHWDVTAEGQIEEIFGACSASMTALPAAKTILEVGCGMGRILKPLSTRFPRLIGLDVSSKMLDLAREYLVDALPKVDLGLIGPDGKYPVSDGTVDLAFSIITFQHMPSHAVVSQSFREVLRILRPGGLFRVQTHIGEPPRPGEYRGMIGCFYPTPRSFAAEASSVGFEVVSVRMTDRPPWIWLTARKPNV